MRAALLVYGSLDTLSGGYLYDRKLVGALRKAGDTVEIVSLPWRGYAAHLFDNISRPLLARLRDLPVDVLIQDELNHPSLFLLNHRLRGRVGYRIVSLVHHLRASERHSAVWMPFYRAVEGRYLRSVDGFIFNSRTTQAVVERFTGGGVPGVVARPGGDRLPLEITPEAITARAHEPGPLRILFLGNVMPRKGLHTLLAALERLPVGAFSVAIAGGLDVDPAYARRMQAAVARNGWEMSVRFHGPLPDERLLPLLHRAQVLALPSQYEGFGIAVLEGMGAGLPALASNAGGAAEIVHNGEDGFLIEAGDAAGLADHLRALAADRALLARMGRRARQSFKAHPTWSESMAQARGFLVGLT